MKPLVCATVTGTTMAELRRERDAVVGANMVELRLDSVADPDVTAALADRRRPVVITCRPEWEGGSFKGSEEERLRILDEALMRGADYVDVEWRAEHAPLLARTAGRRIVLSSHDFDGVPADLIDRARAMRASGAEVIKVAVHANRLSDCATLRGLRRTLGGEAPAVVIAMGPRGVPSRILAAHLGSAWTYAGALTAIGQVGIDELLERYRFRSVTESTSLYGILGSPVGHSVSPAMHNAAFDRGGFDAVYVPLDAADVDDFFSFAEAFGVEGASVTIPFKIPIHGRVREMTPVARRVGAVNTIRTTKEGWIGTNTDVDGFRRPFADRRLSLKGLRASVLGTGGAARGVALALAEGGALVTIHGRNAASARAVAATVSASSGPWPPANGSWDLVVNCTPIGMHPHTDAAPLAPNQLTGRIVYDLVYNPQMTRLLRDARTGGCQTIDGLEMLVAQAEAQFEWWTGGKPAGGVMRAAAMKQLSEYSRDENHVV
jgi:3-dehydroquinate dehydratase/shikimate dehydrogenase